MDGKKYSDKVKLEALYLLRDGAKISEVMRVIGLKQRITIHRWRANGIDYYLERQRVQEKLEKMKKKIAAPNESSDLPEPLIAEEPIKGLMPPDAAPQKGLNIIVIGDMQVKPDIDLDYCKYIGQYCADVKPDVIVNIGDFADMPSLSIYEERGSKKHEGLRLNDDLLAVQRGMRLLMEPIKEAMVKGQWKPRLVMTLRNHEDRITRAINSNPKHLEGKLHMSDLQYEEWGWEVYPFLEPVIIQDVAFSHYFPSGVMGRPITTARQLLIKKHMSCVAGHKQGAEVAPDYRADGRKITAIINGSSYLHDEEYLNHQTNTHFRGIYQLDHVEKGSFEERAITMRFLTEQYGVAND